MRNSKTVYATKKGFRVWSRSKKYISEVSPNIRCPNLKTAFWVDFLIPKSPNMKKVFNDLGNASFFGLIYKTNINKKWILQTFGEKIFVICKNLKYNTLHIKIIEMAHRLSLLKSHYCFLHFFWFLGCAVNTNSASISPVSPQNGQFPHRRLLMDL